MGLTKSFDPFAHSLPDLTSESHPLVAIPMYLSCGILYATIAPGYRRTFVFRRKGMLEVSRDLSSDLARVDGYGIQRLVTTMSSEEILEDGLAGLLTDLEGLGIDWSHLPFPKSRQEDEGFQDYLECEVAVIRADMLAGRKVAVHAEGWGGGLVHRLATIISMLDPDMPQGEARALSTYAAQTGNSLIPFSPEAVWLGG